MKHSYKLNRCQIQQERNGLHNLIRQAKKMKPESEKKFKHDVGL